MQLLHLYCAKQLLPPCSLWLSSTFQSLHVQFCTGERYRGSIVTIICYCPFEMSSIRHHFSWKWRQRCIRKGVDVGAERPFRVSAIQGLGPAALAAKAPHVSAQRNLRIAGSATQPATERDHDHFMSALHPPGTASCKATAKCWRGHQQTPREAFRTRGECSSAPPA